MFISSTAKNSLPPHFNHKPAEEGMIKAFYVLIIHEILISMRQAFHWLTPILFFIMVVCLFPIALGGNQMLLQKIAPGIIWVAVLLAVLLSIGNIFKVDAQEGFLDLMLMSQQPLTLLVFCKIFSHWLLYGLPLILISPILGILLNLSVEEQFALIITLLLGTPVLSLLGAIGASLITGVRSHGLLLPILIMPLYVPVLIFGTGTIIAASAHQPINGYLAIMGALMLFSLAFAPYVAAVALRIGVNQ